MTTYAPAGEDGERRISSAQQAVRSWARYLVYPGEISLHVADDGSVLPNYPEDIRGCWPLGITFSRQERKGVGASLNAGIRRGAEAGIDYFLYAVDDWEVQAPFDLEPWVRILEADPSIGMIRLGPPHPQLTGRIENHDSNSCNGWVMRLDRYAFAFAHRPALYHRHFFETYGPFQEGCNAYVCEQEYSERFNSSIGPDIALALPHPWVHNNNVELAGVEPG